MNVTVQGESIHFVTGGRAHRPGLPYALFVHGAGGDHTVWALQSRWVAFHGMNVVAVDLPGHGRSGGMPSSSIAQYASFVERLLDALGIPSAAVIGHSMGALIGLESAVLSPARVGALALIGAAASMPVHPALLAAAKADSHEAIDMVNLWGHGAGAGLGDNAAPGQWMVGVGERTLERARPGVLFADLTASNEYANGLERAALVNAPTVIMAGERDMMTPLKGARALATAIRGAKLEVLRGAGHMLMAERPDEVLSILATALPVSRARSRGAA